MKLVVEEWNDDEPESTYGYSTLHFPRHIVNISFSNEISLLFPILFMNIFLKNKRQMSSSMIP